MIHHAAWRRPLRPDLTAGHSRFTSSFGPAEAWERTSGIESLDLRANVTSWALGAEWKAGVLFRQTRFEAVLAEALRAAGESVQGWVVTSRESEDADARVGILDLGARTIRALPGQAGETSGPVVAPGGRLVAFLDRTGNSRRIVIQDVVSGAREEVLADASDVQWAPEGDYLYYFEFNNVYRLPISIQGGFAVRGEREFVLQAESDASYSVGPEGRIVLLTTRLSFPEERENYDVIERWRDYDAQLDQ